MAEVGFTEILISALAIDSCSLNYKIKKRARGPKTWRVGSAGDAEGGFGDEAPDLDIVHHPLGEPEIADHAVAQEPIERQLAGGTPDVNDEVMPTRVDIPTPDGTRLPEPEPELDVAALRVGRQGDRFECARKRAQPLLPELEQPVEVFPPLARNSCRVVVGVNVGVRVPLAKLEAHGLILHLV